jgi:hypothetical protein
MDSEAAGFASPGRLAAAAPRRATTRIVDAELGAVGSETKIFLAAKH